MRQVIFIALIVFTGIDLKAQLFGKNDLSVQYGTMNFHAKSLNNSANSNRRLSHVTELDKHLHLGKFASINTGLGIGTLQNLDNRFKQHESSQFMRLKLGLVLHLPQAYSPHNWSPKLINPYFKVAYNIDIFNHLYKATEGRSMGNSVRFGLGFIYKINHTTGIVFETSHNQCLSSDFRTYYQHNIGLVINMDQKFIEW